MSLVQRVARPLKRDADQLRDTRLFIVACDDTYAPKQYFDFFKITRVHVHVIPTLDGTSNALSVLERLLKVEHEGDDELWMLLDTDHCASKGHLKSYTSALRDAKKKNVNVAVSRSCFEIWLLLHHVEESEVKNLENARAVEMHLRRTLSGYNKTNLNSAHYPITSVVEAYKRAEKLDRSVGGGDIPDGNTSRVYLLWKSIITKALRSQLPLEFHDLLPLDGIEMRVKTNSSEVSSSGFGMLRSKRPAVPADFDPAKVIKR